MLRQLYDDECPAEMTRQSEIEFWRCLVMKDRCYNVKELQEMREISRPAVYDLLKRKELPVLPESSDTWS